MLKIESFFSFLYEGEEAYACGKVRLKLIDDRPIHEPTWTTASVRFSLKRDSLLALVANLVPVLHC